MRTFDLKPLYRSTIGFDRFADLFAQLEAKDGSQSSYPPFNIEKTSDDTYRISIAAAGFSEDEIVIEYRQNQLVVTAKKERTDDESVFLHGASRSVAFSRSSSLPITSA